MARPSSSITAPTSSSHVANCQFSDAGRGGEREGSGLQSANQFWPPSFSRPDSRTPRPAACAAPAVTASGRRRQSGVYTEEAVLIMVESCEPVVDGGHSGQRRYRQRVPLPGVLSATVAAPGFRTVRYKDDALSHIGTLRARVRGRYPPGSARRDRRRNVSHCRNPPAPYSPVQLRAAEKQRRYTGRRK